MAASYCAKPILTFDLDLFMLLSPSAANKQLSFLQHVSTILKQRGRAAIVCGSKVTLLVLLPPSFAFRGNSMNPNFLAFPFLFVHDVLIG